MRALKRCFIAIDIPAENSLPQLLKLLRKEFNASQINWVQPEKIHLTLAFLGEISDGQIDLTIKVLNEICLKFEPFNCNLKGFGSFGTKEKPTVLWIGVYVSRALYELKLKFDKGLEITGFNYDGKIFKPHLTLGRIKKFANHAEYLQLTGKYKDFSFLNFEVRSVILYESILSSSGPDYKPIKVFPLEG